MSDWYDIGLENLKADIVEEAMVDRESVNRVYDYLVNIGLIDYDIEKEIIYENYANDEDKTDDDEE